MGRKFLFFCKKMFYSCEENFYFCKEKNFFIVVSQVAACIYRKIFLKLQKKNFYKCPRLMSQVTAFHTTNLYLPGSTLCTNILLNSWSALVKFCLISIIKFIWFFTKPHYIRSIFEKISQKYSSQCDGKKRKEKTAHLWTSWC